jgi:membrane-associated phospholipid phosphatase
MAAERPRNPRVLAAIAAVALVATAVGLGALVALRGAHVPWLDAEWMEEIVEHRSPVWEGPALVFNYLGGGVVATFVVPLAVLAVLLALRHWWSALYWVLAVALSAGLVQLLKNLFDRARPHDILVVADHGSFPSGHTANAATMAVVIGIIAWRWWVWALGALYTVAMALSRTYLGAHWVTDTVGGMLLGAGVAVLVWAVLAVRLERARAHRASRRAGERTATVEP